MNLVNCVKVTDDRVTSFIHSLLISISISGSGSRFSD